MWSSIVVENEKWPKCGDKLLKTGRHRASTKLAILIGLAGLTLRCSERRSVARENQGQSASNPGVSNAGDAQPSATESGGASAPVVQRTDEILEGGKRYPVRAWRFSLPSTSVRIVDVGMKSTLLDALGKSGATVAVNGGFFGVDDKPMGLALTDGVTLSAWSKKLSGGVVVITSGQAKMYEAESYIPTGNPSFAIQCRPRLVVDGVVNVKSDDGHRAERTALCLRDAGQTLEVVVVHGADVGSPTGPSLFALAKHLAAQGCDDALNLDGGPSTGVAWKDGPEPKELPPRGNVRHAVVFVDRRSPPAR